MKLLFFFGLLSILLLRWLKLFLINLITIILSLKCSLTHSRRQQGKAKFTEHLPDLFSTRNRSTKLALMSVTRKITFMTSATREWWWMRDTDRSRSNANSRNNSRWNTTIRDAWRREIKISKLSNNQTNQEESALPELNLINLNYFPFNFSLKLTIIIVVSTRPSTKLPAVNCINTWVDNSECPLSRVQQSFNCYKHWTISALFHH